MPDPSQVYHFISLLSCHKGFFPLPVHSVNGINGPSPWEHGTQNMGEKRNMPLQLGLEVLLFDFKKVVDWKLFKKKKKVLFFTENHFYQIQQILSCFEVLFNMENVYCFFFFCKITMINKALYLAEYICTLKTAVMTAIHQTFTQRKYYWEINDFGRMINSVVREICR